MGRRLDRLDRVLGTLLWKPLTFLLSLCTAGCIWVAVAILRETDGTERVIGVIVAVVAALVFGAGAFQAARKRRISEIDP
ncbi:MAG: hypothetical protein PVF05_05280 [Gemmatimonadales bacterium]|jgi:hypothetical protein